MFTPWVLQARPIFYIMHHDNLPRVFFCLAEPTLLSRGITMTSQPRLNFPLNLAVPGRILKTKNFSYVSKILIPLVC